jgi:hypothetical protein
MRPLFLKPVVIPPSILNLKKVKLAGKLLLSMCAADPREKIVRLRRALRITRPGLRKLEQRLVAKGLLIQQRHQRMVHVEQLDGHFGSELTIPENKKKVVRPPSSAPAPETCALVVPPELLECRYLAASAKMLLAYYAAHPSASNACVVDTLGISLAGLKKLKRALIAKRVLAQADDSYTIRLPGHVLLQSSEGGHFIPESEAVKNGHEIAHPAPKLTPAQDVYNNWLSTLEQMRGNPDTTQSYCLNFTANRIKQIETESPEGPEREAALAAMKEAANVFFARNVLGDIIKKYEARVLTWTANATPEQLAAFREKIEGMMLAGVATPDQANQMKNPQNFPRTT